tara:strand:+ start:6055 stop:6462 length:408 start_codon:yes stop_codon:yes gene_type:complete
MATKEKYAFAHDFGAGSNNYTFKGPKGKKGLLLDYGIEGVTETFNEVTTAATISVGIAANLDAYGEEIDIGSTATDTVGSLSALTEATSPTVLRSTYIVEPDVAADVAVYIACVAPTGGTPAGIATAYVVIEWQD